LECIHAVIVDSTLTKNRELSMERNMDIRTVKSSQLKEDYNRIATLEESYFELLKKYDDDSTYESDIVLTTIVLELGRRVVDGEKTND